MPGEFYVYGEWIECGAGELWNGESKWASTLYELDSSLRVGWVLGVEFSCAKRSSSHCYYAGYVGYVCGECIDGSESEYYGRRGTNNLHKRNSGDSVD